MSEEKKIEKKVKIRTLRPVLVDRHVDKTGDLRGTIVPEGKEIEVSEAEAKELCDTQFRGHYSFGGERQYGTIIDDKFVSLDKEAEKDATKMHDYRRAVRVA